jgi:DNA-directed RNA polymerase subunit M/transcription elongation factor TFIIS
MHFCKNCNNMYYIKIAEASPNVLMYYCRKCGDENDTITVENVSLSKINVKMGDQHFSNVINKYTKLDPTLPRISHLACPNDECSTNSAENPTLREIIYIRYDDANIKYVYLCSTCDIAWKL